MKHAEIDELYEYEIDECLEQMKYNYISSFSNQRTAESAYVVQVL